MGLRSWCVAVCVALLVTNPAAAGPGKGRGLAPTVAARAAATGFSGTILVSDRGRTRYFRSFGLADRAFAVPARNDTRYRIASITKLFTSVLILQLKDEGRIDLDAPFGRYLPGYVAEAGARVTVRQLMNHSSGIAQWDSFGFEEALAKGIPHYQLPRTPAALFAECCSAKLVRTPGEAFDYNNADYIALGRVIEALTGTSYEAALAARILKPLGMKQSGVAHQSAIEPRLAPTYFKRPDTGKWMNDLPVFFENWDASGAMLSSATDLAVFAEALYGGRLISPESFEELLAPGLDDYGLGLWSYRVKRGGREHRVAKRPGSIMGANTQLYRLVDRKATVIILANSNAADLDAFVQEIGDVLLAE